MAANRPVTTAERRRIAKLHGEGLARNDIAKAMKRSASTITKICGELGLSFDRSATQAATAAKVADAKSKRAEIMNGLLDDVQRLRAQLFSEAIIFSFGGKENSYNEKPVPEPPARDKRDLMGSISLALTASMRLDEHDRGTDADEARSMVDDLFDALGVAWNQYHETHPYKPPEGT